MSDEEDMDFFHSFDFTPRRPCPFCQVPMKVMRLGDSKMYEEHHSSHFCDNNNCKMPPSSRYSLTWNESKNEFMGAIIVVQHEGTYYQLFCNKEQNETWMEKLLPNGPGTYWVPKPIVELTQYINFNPDSPIESGLEIVRRLLDLTPFY